MKNCPWCGDILKVKALDLGSTIKYICGKCGFKIKEFAKPEPPKQEKKPEVLEVRQEEVPVAKPTPSWPFILSAIILILLIIVFVKIFLL